jgi:hypothetical protein
MPPPHPDQAIMKVRIFLPCLPGLQKSAGIKLWLTVGMRTMSTTRKNCVIKAVKDEKTTKIKKMTADVINASLLLFRKFGSKIVNTVHIKMVLAKSLEIF